jgi:RNA polymerase sigma-70 factor, ECF subfamily
MTQSLNEVSAHEPELEAATIQRILRGESQLFETLYTPHQKRVRAYALSIVRNTADADDVVQNTAIQAFRQLGRFRQASRFSTWLFAIARNESLQLRRKLSRGNIIAISSGLSGRIGWEATLEDKSLSPFEQFARREVTDAFSNSLQTLPERLRVAFELRECDGLRIRHIAQRLNLTTQAVKSRLFRARALMHQNVTKWNGSHQDARLKRSA